MWLFPTGQPHPSSGAGEVELVPTPPGPALPPPPSAPRISGCGELFSSVEEKLQTEFHSMVQVSLCGPDRSRGRSPGRSRDVTGRRSSVTGDVGGT